MVMFAPSTQWLVLAVFSPFDHLLYLATFLFYLRMCLPCCCCFFVKTLAGYDSDEWGELEEDDDRVHGQW